MKKTKFIINKRRRVIITPPMAVSDIIKKLIASRFGFRRKIATPNIYFRIRHLGYVNSLQIQRRYTTYDAIFLKYIYLHVNNIFSHISKPISLYALGLFQCISLNAASRLPTHKKKNHKNLTNTRVFNSSRIYLSFTSLILK